jgi:hypothetical protein
MKRRTFGLLVCGVLAAAQSLRADAVSYGRVVDLEAKGDTFVVKHHHDWSRATGDARYAMISGSRDPFTAENTYASLSWQTRTGETVRKVPSPALTWLGVTADSRYVIGLSSLKLDNPYQLVVYSRDGTLLLRRHITPGVACLTPAEFGKLRGAHPEASALLKDRAWRDGGSVYVDYDDLSPRALGPLGQALAAHACPSPFSAAFSESVTNSVSWYDEKDPAPVVLETAGVPSAVRLKDPKGVLFTVPFRLDAP